MLTCALMDGQVYVLAHRSPEVLCDWLAAVRERHFDRRVGPLHAVSCSERYEGVGRACTLVLSIDVGEDFALRTLSTMRIT